MRDVRTALLPLGLLIPVVCGHAEELSADLAARPALPRLSVDTTLPRTKGRVIEVRKGGNLQRAIYQARRGDTIRVDPNGQWPAVLLPAKPGQGWVRIETMATRALPEAGQRVQHSHARFMPTIWNITTETPRPALNTELGASHYRLVGLRFKSRKYEKDGHNKLFMLGRGKSTMMQAKTPEQLPHHIIVDRCILEGWPGNTSRGMYLDGRHVAVVGCQILDVTATLESHGILITDTPGPILIENNAIGASGINIFIGDNNPLRWPEVNAADITIRGNLLYKKPEWKAGSTLKNHFEMKRGQRVLFEENECVYSPVDAQTGYSLKLKTGGHDQFVTDVTIRNNRIREVNGYLAISNTDPDDGLERILSDGNQVDGIFDGGVSIMFLIESGAQGVKDVAFIGDTLRGAKLKSFLTFGGSVPNVQRLEIRNVVADHGQYGIKGDGTPSGRATLEKFCETYDFRDNSLIGTSRTNSLRFYPGGNRHLASSNE